jgi:hypothetical protein
MNERGWRDGCEQKGQQSLGAAGGAPGEHSVTRGRGWLVRPRAVALLFKKLASKRCGIARNRPSGDPSSIQPHAAADRPARAHLHG